jgi:hypothetical protein
VLVDITLGSESGLELVSRLDHTSGATVILVSTHAEGDFADLIADTPAAGFVAKSDLSADAIRRLAREGPCREELRRAGSDLHLRCGRAQR